MAGLSQAVKLWGCAHCGAGGWAHPFMELYFLSVGKWLCDLGPVTGSLWALGFLSIKQEAGNSDLQS